MSRAFTLLHRRNGSKTRPYGPTSGSCGGRRLCRPAPVPSPPPPLFVPALNLVIPAKGGIHVPARADTRARPGRGTRLGGSLTLPVLLRAAGQSAPPYTYRSTRHPIPILSILPILTILFRSLSVLFVSLWLTAISPALALANGGTIQVSNQRSGPYLLTIFTDPTPVRVGVVDVSTLVQRADGDEVVRDAQVTVVAGPVGHQADGGTYQATHELATNKLYYAANVSLPAEGRWRIEVRVTGDAGEGEAAFEVEASRGSPLDTPLFLLLLAVPPAVLLIWWFSRVERR